MPNPHVDPRLLGLQSLISKASFAPLPSIPRKGPIGAVSRPGGPMSSSTVGAVPRPPILTPPPRPDIPPTSPSPTPPSAPVGPNNGTDPFLNLVGDYDLLPPEMTSEEWGNLPKSVRTAGFWDIGKEYIKMGGAAGGLGKGLGKGLASLFSSNNNNNMFDESQEEPVGGGGYSPSPSPSPFEFDAEREAVARALDQSAAAATASAQAELAQKQNQQAVVQQQAQRLAKHELAAAQQQKVQQAQAVHEAVALAGGLGAAPANPFVDLTGASYAPGIDFASLGIEAPLPDLSGFGGFDVPSFAALGM